ncbi:MAG: hypothetical protein KF685_11540 [Acidobacteria bacterium]|nr:hypothetical protein [Acidobacteriota bacterium]
MKLSEIKEILPTMAQVRFQMEGGGTVPEHFHVTEIGKVTKDFIDCGGTVRREELINFQLWYANDGDHRLLPEKLLKIIAKSEKTLDLKDGEVEIEYQSDTIGRYSVEFSDGRFVLKSKNTTCLAKEECGVTEKTTSRSISEMPVLQTACCGAGVGCC